MMTKGGFFMDKKEKKLFKNVKSLAFCAMLTAMSVVIGIFCKSFLNFGGGLFRITLENLPIIVAGIAFGGVVGGAVGGAVDIISYLLSSQIYPPNLIVTLGAVMVGVISGVVGKRLGRSSPYKRIILSSALAHIVGSMVIKPIGLFRFYGFLVLWRIPLYLLIAPLEIFVICLLYKNREFRSFLDEN